MKKISLVILAVFFVLVNRKTVVIYTNFETDFVFSVLDFTVNFLYYQCVHLYAGGNLMDKTVTLEKEQTKKKTGGGKTALTIIAVILVTALSLLLFATHNWKADIVDYDTDNPYITPYGTTLVSAHRSGGGIFPENTMMAFEGCINSGTFKTDIFEFDLHITKDGELIILHDDTLDRTTDSEEVFGVKGARPEDYTLEELKTLNFGEGFTDDKGVSPYKGLRGDDVPDSLRAATLKEVLLYLEENGGFKYIIEIKNSDDLGYASADRLYGVLNEMDLLNKAIIGTFNGEVTKYLDSAYPEMLRSASIKEVLGFYFDSVFGAEREDGYYKFTALQIPANQFLIKLGTSKMTDYAHKNNIAVQYWTINDPDDMRMLKEINADCVMSDTPDIAYSVLNEE